MDETFYSIDLPAIIIAALSGLCCSLIGSFLLFQKKSMMADTLTHSILPGLALAYIVTGNMSTVALLPGAFASCLLAAFLVHLIYKHTILDSTISMGVVLTTMFASGIIILELFIDGRVHLDTEHALYGALELTYWAKPYNLETLPASIKTLAVLSIILMLTSILFYKQLRLTLFDPNHAKLTGIRTDFINFTILLLTVTVCVACFDAVGSILVLALLICPPAIARLLTNSFLVYIILSVAIGIICGVLGYFTGALLPLILGYEHSLSAAGSIAVIAEILLIVSLFYSTNIGYFSKASEK